MTLPGVLPGRAGGGAANEKLNLALLGCGNRMRQLLPSILNAGENVVALCDVDERQVARLKKEAGLEILDEKLKAKDTGDLPGLPPGHPPVQPAKKPDTK